MITITKNIDTAFEVEFLSCVIDKSDNLRVMECDEHFCKFLGVRRCVIDKGGLYLHDILIPQDREDIMQQLCKRNSSYVYLDLYLKDKNDNFHFVHCIAKNNDEDNLCLLTFADVSRSIEKSKKIKEKAKTINRLIDLINGGVCLFRVNNDMHFEVIFANDACCRYFGTTKENARAKAYRFDEVIHPDDKSACYQAIGMAMATKKPIDMDIRIMTHKDEFIWVKWNSSIQKYDEDGCPVFHAIFTDISGVKRAEQDADRQRDMLVKMFKSIPGPVFVTDCESPFRLNIVSEDFIRFVGYSRTELFDDFDGDLSKIIDKGDVENACRMLDFKGSEAGVINVTYSIKTKSGAYKSFVDRRRVVELETGEKSLMGMLLDMSATRFDDYLDF